MKYYLSVGKKRMYSESELKKIRQMWADTLPKFLSGEAVVLFGDMEIVAVPSSDAAGLSAKPDGVVFGSIQIVERAADIY